MLDPIKEVEKTELPPPATKQKTQPPPTNTRKPA